MNLIRFARTSITRISSSYPAKRCSLVFLFTCFSAACGSGGVSSVEDSASNELNIGAASENVPGDIVEVEVGLGLQASPDSQISITQIPVPSSPEPVPAGTVVTPVQSVEDNTPVVFVPESEALPVAELEPVEPEPAEPEPAPAVVLEDVACDADPETLRTALLELTNQARAIARSCGNSFHEAVAPLQWDDSLSRAAFNHSSDMSTHNFFSHTGSDGSTPAQRATDEGFVFSTVGENIAAGQRTTGTVQQGWLESPGHCQNIMRPNYTHMGASCVLDTGADFSRYWTVVFGRPR